jgi:hypothetical protein
MLLSVAFATLCLALLPIGAAAQSNDPADEFVLRISGDERVAADEQRGYVIVIDGDLLVDGTVWDLVVVVDGNITVGDLGLINTDVILTDGELCVREGGYVAGDVLLGDDGRVSSDPACSGQIAGTIDNDAFSFDWEGAAALWTSGVYLATWATLALLLIVGALLFAGIGGRQLWSSAELLTERPGPSLLSAFIIWVGLAVLAGILVVTVLGIPAAFALLVLGGALWLLGLIVAGTRIGAALTRRPIDVHGENHPYLPAVTGAVALSLIALLAFGGALVVALSAIFGDGLGTLGAFAGIPSLVLSFLLWLIGTVGAGALAYRALIAWRAPDNLASDS